MATENCAGTGPDDDGLRQALFSAAKWRWGWGLGLGYVAAVAVPLAIWLHVPRWIGLSLAAATTVLGSGLRWWSASFRLHANSLLRDYELSSVGHPRDRVLSSHILAAHPRIVRKAARPGVERTPYHEARGHASTELLVGRMRESAWWTEKLASKAMNWSYALGCVAILLVLVSFASAGSVGVRVHATAILLVVLVGILQLGWQYGQLAKTSGRAFSTLDALLVKCDLSEREALMEVSKYQTARDAAPLIPDWLWRLYRRDLQDAWTLLSASHEGG